METKSMPSNNTPKRRRFRRWWIVLTVVTLLLIIIWSLPYLASTGPGERLTLRVANKAVPQTVNFSNMSLSWLGPISLRDVHLEDPDSRAVVDVDMITWSKGLLSALKGVENFGLVQLEQPRISLPAESLSQQKEKVEDKDKKEKDKKDRSDTQPRGRLTVNNGYVRITRADGEILEVKDISTNVDLDTMDKMKGDFHLAFAGGGKVMGDFDVEGATGGLEKMKAMVNVNTDEPVNLEPFAVFAGPDVTAGGQADLRAKARIADGQVHSDFEMKIAQLKAGRKTETLNPVNINLTGDVKTATDKIIGSVVLGGDVGQITSQFEMPVKSETFTVNQEAIMAALMGEKDLALPEFSLTSDGRIDLAMLARAVPSLLKTRPGSTLQEGELTLRDISVTGGAQPAARGGLEISRISGLLQKPGETATQTIAIEPITADFDVRLASGRGLQISKARLNSAFMEATAGGDIQNLTTQFQANLQAMEQQLATLFTYEPRGLSGRLTGTTQFSRRDEGWQVQADIAGAELAYPSEKGKLEIGRMQLTQSGRLTLREGKADRYQVAQMQLNVDDALQAQATGDFSLTGGGLQANATVQQLDLNRATQWLSAWQGKDTTPMKGNLTLQADMVQAPQTRVLTIRGQGKVASLLVGKASPADAVNVDFGWEEIRWDPAAADLGVTAFELHGRLAQLARSAAEADAANGPLLSVRGGGKVKNIRQQPVLDLKGDYQSSWEQVTRWLHQSFPDTRKSIQLQGDTGGPFTLTGPLRSSPEKPAGSGLTGDFRTGWAAASLYGLTFGQVLFAAQLRDGVITLPDTPVTAGDGVMNLGGVVDLTAQPPVVRLQGKRNLLVKLPITPDTGNQLLSRFNPIFSNLTQLQGSINLDTVDLVIPLSKEHFASAGGSGSLDLKEMMMQPGGLLAELLPMEKFSDKRIVPVRTEVLNFQLKDGGVYYEKFRVNIAEILPLNFRGQVGLNDQVKMWVSVPLSMPLLERILSKSGRQLPALVTQNLEKINLELPITGTRLKPVLDFSSVDIPKLLQQVVEGAVQTPLDTIFDIIRTPRQQQQNQAPR